MALRLFSRKAPDKSAPAGPQSPVKQSVPRQAARASAGQDYQAAATMAYSEDVLERAVQMQRFGMIAVGWEQWRDYDAFEAAYSLSTSEIDTNFAMVPEGLASLPRTIIDMPGVPEQDYATEAFLLAKRCVTNSEYQHFVDAGGYSEYELFPQDIWPCLIDFVDLTEMPGPRYWRHGRFDERLADHPVVGLCYYEAAAYARWAGYRLPSEPEWHMASTWRIRSSAYQFRRFPWGDAMDRERCNLWISGVGTTVAVDQYPGGAAPNGILQLIGNVWEWCASDFEVLDEEGRQVVGDTLLKSIRGGAFDTYFPSQATSFFRTGLSCLARAHNVGKRCALDLPES